MKQYSEVDECNWAPADRIRVREDIYVQIENDLRDLTVRAKYYYEYPKTPAAFCELLEQLQSALKDARRE